MKLSISALITKTKLNDFKVYGVDLDINNYEFKVSIEGAYWFKDDNSEPVEMENGGYIIVRSYESFEARYFLSKDKL